MRQKVVITSGAMQTKIDAVRQIINSSTGSLGSKFADQFAKEGYDVVYVHTSGAMMPKTNTIRTICIEVSQQLVEALKEELTGQVKPIVIHAMAIADFEIPTITSVDEIYNLCKAVKSKEEFIDQLEKLGKPKKLASNSDQLAYFKRDAKVIDQIKDINPTSILVGFKLLSGVCDEELLTVARKLQKRTNCDLVVANIKERINEKGHEAFIISNQEQRKVYQKDEIVSATIKKVSAL